MANEQNLIPKQEKSSIELKLDHKNYRIHDENNKKLINKSLQETGAGRSILIDNENEIIAGNGVYEQAKKLNIPIKIVETNGKELIAVKRTDLQTNDKKRQKLAVFDNSTSDNSVFDIELLKQDFDITELQDFGIEMSEDEIVKEIIEDEVPTEVETKCKKGDIWILGNHRLMCGDSTVITDIEKLMDGQKADMVFTDPPWNVNYGAVSKDNAMGYKPRTIQNDSMPTEDFSEFMNSVFALMFAFSKAGCLTYVVMSAQEWGNMMLRLKENNYHWSSTIIWNKDRLVMSRKDYHTKYEPIWYGWTEGSRLHPLTDRKQSDVWDIPRPSSSPEHPTMKPIELIARAVQNSSKRNDLVVDVFGGSGSTLIACEQVERKCNMMELEEKYCDVIIQRWENFTGKKAELI